MKWATLLPLALSTISLMPSTAAWQVSWHDSDDNIQKRTGHGPSDCIEIDNPEGNVFKIDAQGEKGVNMLLFPNSKCSGEPVGSATDEFSKESSRDLRGFKVVSLSTSTSSETTTTGKSASHAATSSPKSSSAHASSSSGSGRGQSSTAKTTAATSAAATSTSGASSDASATTSTAASATPTNAAVQVSGGLSAKGLVGSVMGLAMAQWLI